MRTPAALIYNPAAGRAGPRLLAAIADRLAAGEWALDEPIPTRAPGHATELAAELAAGGVAEAVFAYGGDGTLREAAAGLFGSEVALGPLPGGTANVLVRALGIPPAPLDAAAALGESAARRRLDVGRCDGRPFLMNASAGLDGVVLERLAPRFKARLGRIAIGVQAVVEWLRGPPPPVAVEVDGRVSDAAFVAACNIPHYGGPFLLAPQASFDDGELDLVMLTGQGRLPLLGFARDLGLGRHLARPDVSYRRRPRLRLLAPDPLPLQLDGDPLPIAPPVTVTVTPRALAVLVPASSQEVRR